MLLLLLLLLLLVLLMIKPLSQQQAQFVEVQECTLLLWVFASCLRRLAI
jgi:hypothetical protein